MASLEESSEKQLDLSLRAKNSKFLNTGVKLDQKNQQMNIFGPFMPVCTAMALNANYLNALKNLVYMAARKNLSIIAKILIVLKA